MKRSTDHEFYQEIERPIGAMAKSYPSGYAGVRHHHSRAQLLYAESGTMKVTTNHGSWIIPPHRAVWFPPECPHQTGTLTPVEMRTLYIRRDACSARAPEEPHVIQVSPLLRELVRRATAMPIEYDEKGHDGKILDLLLDEINWSPVDVLVLPILRDPRLLVIEQAVLSNPGDNRTLEAWAERVATSSRTLTRLFLKESGMSFRSWRDQIRALSALPKLIEGEQVTRLAIEMGYETPGAFGAMFKRVMGVTPSMYASMEKE